MNSVSESFAAFLGWSLVVVGLSHAVRPAWWSRVMSGIVARPDGAMILAAMSLPIGLAGVTMHNRWEWSWRVIVTVLCWAWTIKGTLYLLFPGLPARVAQPHVDRPWGFVVAGALLVGLGAAVLAELATTAEGR